MRFALLLIIFCPAALIGDDIAASTHPGSPMVVGSSYALAPQNAELTGKVGSVAREIHSTLDRFDKILAAPGSRLKSAWRAAEGYLESAEENHKKILTRYSSRFDQKNAAWVKLETRLRKAQADGKAFKARIASGGGSGAAPVAKPTPKAAPTAKLTGSAGYALKKVVQSLESHDKTMARAGDDKDKAATYRAAKRDLDEASEQHQKISRDYAGQFDVAHPQWVAVTARIAKANTDIQAFYAAEVDGGGTKADGSKVTGYADAQSIVAANSPNRTSVDRAVAAFLRETESIRGFHERKDKQANLMDKVNRSLNNAKKSMSRLQRSYGSIINKESTQYLALQHELAQAERRSSEIPALIAVDVTARERLAAENKRLAELARQQSDAKQAAAYKKYVAKCDAERAARAKALIDNCRFPAYRYQNAELDKIATAFIRKSYPNHKIERLQVREAYEELREARFRDGVVTFGTYRYLRPSMILRSASGKVELYHLDLRNTLQADGTWGPLQFFRGRNSGMEMRNENIHK